MGNSSLANRIKRVEHIKGSVYGRVRIGQVNVA
jgi:hypothetical protein